MAAAAVPTASNPRSPMRSAISPAGSWKLAMAPEYAVFNRPTWVSDSISSACQIGNSR